MSIAMSKCEKCDNVLQFDPHPADDGTFEFLFLGATSGENETLRSRVSASDNGLFASCMLPSGLVLAYGFYTVKERKGCCDAIWRAFTKSPGFFYRCVGRSYDTYSKCFEYYCAESYPQIRWPWDLDTASIVQSHFKTLANGGGSNALRVLATDNLSFEVAWFANDQIPDLLALPALVSPLIVVSLINNNLS
jgi:hypothetical protein